MNAPALFKESTVRSWDELEMVVRPLAARGHGPFRQYAFRGQHDERWSLMPTLARELEEAGGGKSLFLLHETFERTLLLLFKSKVHLYLPLHGLVPAGASSILDWLVLGRHHGLPTRLLDWTFSPYVAAWNAACERSDADGTIWAVSVEHVNAPDDVRALMSMESENLRKIARGERTEKKLLFFTPRAHNARSAAQQGLFSIARDPTADHRPLLDEVCVHFEKEKPSPDPIFHRIFVKGGSKRELIRELRKRNVTAETLSPDLDGFCRELGQVLRDHPEELFRWKDEGLRG